MLWRLNVGDVIQMNGRGTCNSFTNSGCWVRIYEHLQTLGYMNIYKQNGYKDRNDYLESLAEDYCIDIDTVMVLADILGPNEDFDGLITSLEDIDMWT